MPSLVSFFDDFVAQIVSARWYVLGALAVATATAAFATRRTFDFSPGSLYEGSGSLVQDAAAFHADFGRDDALVLIVLEAVSDRDVLDRAAITWQARTSQHLATIDGVDRVETLATLQLPRPQLHPPFWMKSPVIRNTPATVDDEHRLRAVLERYKLIENNLISQDHRASVAAILLNTDSSMADLRRCVQRVKQIVKDHPPPSGFRSHLTGLPVFRIQVAEDLQAEQRRQLPAVAIIFVIFLGLVFRCSAGVLLPLTAVGIAIVWTVGLMSTMGLPFNLISNVLPVMLLAIGVANCVHFYLRFLEESRRAGTDLCSAATSTVRRMASACFLACATTAIGFLSICGARSRTLTEFGLEASLGMGLLYVSAILCMGAGLPLFPVPRKDAGSLAGAALGSMAYTVGSAAVRRPRTTLVAGLILVTCCLWSAQRLMINSRMLETYEVGHPTRSAIQLVEDKLGGFASLEVSLTADSADRFVQPSVFDKVADFGRFASTFDQVILVRSYVDLFEQLHAILKPRVAKRDSSWWQGDEGETRLQWVRERVRRVAGSLNYQAFMRADERRARISCRVRDAGTRETLELIGVLEDKLAELFPAGSGIESQLTGESYLYAKLIDQFIRDLFIGLCSASVVIFAIIGFLFRSLRVGLIAVVPNLTPLVVTLGYMGYRGFELNTGNMIVFAVSIGIAVDDTIHFLLRFREELGRRADTRAAVRNTLLRTGRAIWLTTLLIVLGMSVMLFSTFLPTRRFAELTCVTMIAALLGDLILLPACIAVFWRRK